jgi:hypothetical protein
MADKNGLRNDKFFEEKSEVRGSKRTYHGVERPKCLQDVLISSLAFRDAKRTSLRRVGWYQITECEISHFCAFAARHVTGSGFLCRNRCRRRPGDSRRGLSMNGGAGRRETSISRTTWEKMVDFRGFRKRVGRVKMTLMGRE